MTWKGWSSQIPMTMAYEKDDWFLRIHSVMMGNMMISTNFFLSSPDVNWGGVGKKLSKKNRPINPKMGD